ncbi:macrolide transport system ATP-binding/permease protein [Tamaricihabitans halophyticus]|uniref:Macrolide transport system ATP-binding/permease protein n=1 Tax=Tamaricihabitans halophyticus TaxID=1262583 RepID=A0A4R2QYY5_9PSEU|nr:ABC-F family ATP-binding cassette domain-containing protein [Tamaricihabitans halophyticus]TCP54288.1 macrolide transport system ATP-binding/permease protein [Tamaricihabitans halophyticus]
MSVFPLIARDLSKAYQGRPVLDGVSLTAAPGGRLGLVGENGVGKSTLLRLLSGIEQPDTGTVERPGDLGFLFQELPFTMAQTVAEVLDDALADIRFIERRLVALASTLATDPTNTDALGEYGELLEWAQLHDLWDADRRAELVLAGLGLADIAQDRQLGTLSGGQRSRLGLAALLIRQPSTLLLDEPTNHLDDDAAGFLEKHLSQLPGVVVLASHDRVFLDAVCTQIVDLDPAQDGPTRYGGAYSDYLAAKQAERARWEQRYAEEQDELGALRYAVRVTARNVAPNRKPTDNAKMAYDFKAGRIQKQISRRVRNAQQRLDELERDQVRKPPAQLRFGGTLTSTAPVDKLAISVRELRVPRRVEVSALDISTRSRLLLTGPNGAGKSTLLLALAGQLAIEGSVHRARGVRIGLLEQDVVFPRPERTPLQLYPEERAAVPLVDLGLIAPRDLARPVGELSVGQRRRLALALLLADPPQVLLLDEPTNHLSLSLAEELEEALRAAPGAVVIASHDRWLRARWQGQQLQLHDGRVIGLN